MLAILITLGVVVLDQLSKILVRSSIDIGEKVDFIPYVLGLTHYENTGASFGMLKDARWVFLLTSTVAIAVMIGFLVWHYRMPKEKRRNTLFVTSLSFVLGGGIGNMIDRIFHVGENGITSVTDMFEVLFFDFAIFNVADSFVCVGAAMLCVYILFFETKYEKLQKAGHSEDEQPEL